MKTWLEKNNLWWTFKEEKSCRLISNNKENNKKLQNCVVCQKWWKFIVTDLQCWTNIASWNNWCIPLHHSRRLALLFYENENISIKMKKKKENLSISMNWREERREGKLRGTIYISTMKTSSLHVSAASEWDFLSNFRCCFHYR